MKHLMQFKRSDTGEILNIASKIEKENKQLLLEVQQWENGKLSFVQVPIQIIQHEERR